MVKAIDRRRLNATGFTLVELLVVIGVIAMLVSLLLPVLNKARAAARAIQCSSNYREIGQAIFLFANSHDGRAPGHAFAFKPGSPAIGTRFDVSWAQMLDAEIFKKVDLIPVSKPFSSAAKNARLYCPEAWGIQWPNAAPYPGYYQMNCELAGCRNNAWGSTLPAGSFGIYVRNAQWYDGYYSNWPNWSTYSFSSDYGAWYVLGAKLTAYRNPSQKYAVWDSDYGVPYTTESASDIALGASASYPTYDASGGAFSFRHGSNHVMNMLFVDGHVEGLTFSPKMKSLQWFSPTGK